MDLNPARKRMYQTSSHLGKEDREKILKLYFRNPKVQACVNCGEAEKFIAYVDDHPESSMMMLHCLKCGNCTPPFELHKPQMNDWLANQLGILAPNPHLSELPAGESGDEQFMQGLLFGDDEE